MPVDVRCEYIAWIADGEWPADCHALAEPSCVETTQHRNSAADPELLLAPRRQHDGHDKISRVPCRGELSLSSGCFVHRTRVCVLFCLEVLPFARLDPDCRHFGSQLLWLSLPQGVLFAIPSSTLEEEAVYVATDSGFHLGIGRNI